MPGSTTASRLLLVAHHFPPDFTIGSLRPRRVAMRLAALGWSIDVLSARPLYFDDVDETLCQGLEKVHVHRTHAIDPRAWSRRRLAGGRPQEGNRLDDLSAPKQLSGVARGVRGVARWLATRLEIPDRWYGWIPIAAAAGARLQRPAVVLATAPAFSNLIVGRLLAARFRVPLVLDYRDPWNPLERRSELPRSRVRIEARLEQWCLGGATEVIATTPGIAAEIEAIAKRPVNVVTNACEPERFDGVEPRRFDRPTIVYAGGLYGDRRLDPVLNAMASLRDAGRVSPKNLRLLYMGRTPEGASRAVAAYRLEEFVEIRGVRPSREALAATAGATCNLSLVGTGHTRQVPAKIFEQIAAGRPMLAVAPADSDTRVLLHDVPFARCVVAEDIEALKQALLAVAAGETNSPSTGIPAHLTVEATIRDLDTVLRRACQQVPASPAEHPS